MNIHYLQHVPFEGLGSIKTWATASGHNISVTRLYKDDPFPDLDSIDWLIVMGGPMGIYENKKFPWLLKEKDYIKQAIESSKIVLGICLGAQLIADVLGARVYPNKYKEIGWFGISEIRLSGNKSTLLAIPENTEVFHWHGDTFDLPENSILLASSSVCKNQAFLYKDRVLGLQFHLETTQESAQSLIDNCGNELINAPYIQTASEIMNQDEKFKNINSLMNSILDHLVKIDANFLPGS